MRTFALLAPCAALALASGCVSPADDGTPPLTDFEEIDLDDELPRFDYDADRIDGSTDASAEDPPTDDPDEPSDPTDPTENEWAMPPEFVPGLEIHGSVSCGFVDGTFDVDLQFDGDAWHLMGLPALTPRPELMPCFAPDSTVDLEWTDAPILRFAMGNIDHVLAPTETPDRWFGEAFPMVPSAACEAGMEALGLDGAATMVMEVTAVVTPS